MKQVNLIVEKGNDGTLWGRVNYEDNLIIESADNLENLQIQMKALLFDFHELESASISFDISYDLSSFFDAFSYLKISKIAEFAGLNPSLLRHYVAGSKTASKVQVSKIQNAVKKLAQDLMQVEFA